MFQKNRETRSRLEKLTEPPPFKRPEAIPSLEQKKKEEEKEKRIWQQLEKEAKLMERDEKLKEKAEKKVQEIRVLAEKEKIEHLLELAEKEGLIFAVQVAKKMNDPYILDIFHDLLAQEGYYQRFMK